jgi:hypothetical protein
MRREGTEVRASSSASSSASSKAKFYQYKYRNIISNLGLLRTYQEYFWFEVSGFKIQTSYFQLRTSYFHLLPTANCRLQTTYYISTLKQLHPPAASKLAHSGRQIHQLHN